MSQPSDCYFDGAAWTEHVSTHGTQATDPIR